MGYDLGTAALVASATKGGALMYERTSTGDIFPTFVTPAMARAKLNEVRAELQSLDRDIQPSAVPAQFKTEWGVFRDTYEAFYRDTIDNFFAINLGTKGTIEKAEEFQRQGLQWRALFEAQGGKPTAPPPAPPPPSPGLPEVVGKAEGIAKAVAVVAVVGGLVYLASMVKR